MMGGPADSSLAEPCATVDAVEVLMAEPASANVDEDGAVVDSDDEASMHEHAVAAAVAPASSVSASGARARIPAAAAPATVVGEPNPQHGRAGYTRPIFEFIESAASFYTVGSSAYECDVQKLHEHAREGRDVAAEQIKRSIVASLRRAATDFEAAATAADRFSDELLEVDVKESLLRAVKARSGCSRLSDSERH